MADVVATFIDNSITPYDLAQFSVKNGHRTKNDGTAWTFFKAIFKKYPFSKFVQTSKYDDFVSHISKGALVVCSMKPGYWTKGGHFICAWKHDGKYVYANDPASSSRTRQLASDFKKECKQYFIFYPPIGWEDPNDDIGEPTTPPTEPQTPPSEPLPYNGPTGIYDISKWQGNVDFKKVKESNKVGLLILRAGYGQNTIDPRFKEYVTECQKYNIPYGVYWFSYATSVDGARREAESFYKIASPYKPLFYVMDAEDRRVDGSYINAFATRIKEVSGGAKTGLYVANHLFAEYKREGMNLSLWDFIWIPKYTKDPPTWRPCDVWQTGGSRIPGFSGNIDTNVIPSFGRYKIEYYLGWRD
jgi:GH25 family lysozyme M1 (1,4-beta-N-acetylmuramidase)